MRILHIASWYPSKYNPTLGNFVERHVQAINSQCPSTVLAIFSDSNLSETHIDTQTENGLRVIRVSHPARNKTYNRAISFFKVMRILEVDGSFAFDAIHLHVTYPHGWMARWAARKYDIPYVITEHWSIYHHTHKMGLGQKFLDRFVGRGASMIMPVSEDLASRMRAFGMSAPYRVIPNVVDTDLFKVTSKKATKFQFIHISSLVDEIKNVSGIMSAFSRLLAQGVDAHLSIIGDGDTTPYQNLALSYGLDETQISIQGERTIQEVAKHLSSSHCLVMFSNYENLPCVIIESLACGVPVISSNVGGIKEHIDTSRGMLIDKEDVSKLTEAMAKMISNHEKYEPDNLRKYALEHFSINAIARSYQEVYHQVVEG